jgi:hypothetical protein
MAKRTFNKKARALEPAVMKLHFAVPADSVSKYIDISECVSRVCRRFYRQGLNWAVANVKITVLPNAGAAPSQAYVNTIPHTWPVASGWVKAFHAWKDQQDEAIAESGSESAVARFRDFKVHADVQHVTYGFAANLDPLTLGPGNLVGPYPAGLVTGPTVYTAEEWESSQIVVPNILADASGSLVDPTEYKLHMIGINNNGGLSRGIVDGYASSRSYPQSPDPVSPLISGTVNWMRLMSDVGNDTSEITDNATNRNDELPYDQDSYPGGQNNFAQLECQGYVSNASTVGIRTFNTGPFTAPCGLIRLDFLYQDAVSDAGENNIVTVELVPGNHRGYLCETMEEF